MHPTIECLPKQVWNKFCVFVRKKDIHDKRFTRSSVFRNEFGTGPASPAVAGQVLREKHTIIDIHVEVSSETSSELVLRLPLGRNRSCAKKTR